MTRSYKENWDLSRSTEISLHQDLTRSTEIWQDLLIWPYPTFSIFPFISAIYMLHFTFYTVYINTLIYKRWKEIPVVGSWISHPWVFPCLQSIILQFSSNCWRLSNWIWFKVGAKTDERRSVTCRLPLSWKPLSRPFNRIAGSKSNWTGWLKK